MEYQIQPNSRHCAATGNEIQPGEKYFTVLVEENQQFVRRDYSGDAWSGPPTGAFSFWMGHMPVDAARRRPPIDDEILLDCFARLQDSVEPHKVNFRYVVALLLMRRKKLRFEDARLVDGQEVLVLRSLTDKKPFELVNPRLTDDEILAVQEEVFKVLGWD